MKSWTWLSVSTQRPTREQHEQQRASGFGHSGRPGEEFRFSARDVKTVSVSDPCLANLGGSRQSQLESEDGAKTWNAKTRFSPERV